MIGCGVLFGRVEEKEEGGLGFVDGENGGAGGSALQLCLPSSPSFFISLPLPIHPISFSLLYLSSSCIPRRGCPGWKNTKL